MRRIKWKYVVSIALVVLIAGLGVYAYNQGQDFKQSAQNQYNRAFYDLIDEVQNVEISLAKALVANSPKQKAVGFSEVWREAGMAQANLGQLPISHLALQNTSRFLSQVSDYSYTILKQSLAEKDITDEQHQKVRELHQYASTLQQTLGGLSTEMTQGRLKWEELSNKGTAMFASTGSNFTTTQFEGIETEFKDYPTLIYDGPFSDDLKDTDPKGLTGDNKSEVELKNIVSQFVGTENVKQINLIGITEGKMKTYNFEIVPNNEEKGRSNKIVEISEKGGHIISIIQNKLVVMESLSVEQAKQRGKEYLQSIGFSNMRETYYMKENGIATVNYAYVENNVLMYPDIIKVKIAMDNGEIMGFDAKGYYLAHTNRNIGVPNITPEAATTAVNPKLDLKLVGLVVIPTESKKEVLVYEFKGKVDDRDFLVYVNADTGEEEKVLIIIHTPNGTLTM